LTTACACGNPDLDALGCPPSRPTAQSRFIRPPWCPPAPGGPTPLETTLAKFHRNTPRYTDQTWAALKHRNGYSMSKDDRFVAPPPPLEPKPEPAPEVPVDGQA